MKILVLNPLLDCQSEVVTSLENMGVAVILSAVPEEAAQIFAMHSGSIDLAVLSDQPGLDFLKKLKADPSNVDLPVLITHSEWDEQKFAEHQSTPDGANAYLKAPFTSVDLVASIEAIFGKIEMPVEPSPQAEEPAAANTEHGNFPPVPTFISDRGSARPPAAPPDSVIVEDATAIFMRSDVKGENSIKLEAPRIRDDDFPLPGAVAGIQQKQTLISQEQIDRDLAAELPYLLPDSYAAPTQKAAQTPAQRASAHQAGGSNAQQQPRQAGAMYVPATDALVPGGMMHSPDSETLKKYLVLREQDVAVLSIQLKAAQEQIGVLEKQLVEEKGKSTDLEATLTEYRRKVEDFDRQRDQAVEKLDGEISELRFQLKARRDKARALEAQVKAAQGEIEKMKERVRSDIRKIRMREKELENRLEITKKDSEALLQAREVKIIELKRKLDLLEFNMDLLHDQHSREKESSAKLRERLTKAAQVVRVMGGLLDANGVPLDSIDGATSVGETSDSDGNDATQVAGPDDALDSA